jgi:hypothetical protein
MKSMILAAAVLFTSLAGSFFGQDVTNGSGGAGTQHDSTMTIELVR